LKYSFSTPMTTTTESDFSHLIVLHALPYCV